MKKIYFLIAALIGTTALFAQNDMTFRVDLNTTGASADGIYVTGSWMAAAGLSGDWIEPGSDAGAKMTDADGDGVYTLTVSLPAGAYQFKYANGNTWPNAEAGGGGDNYQSDLSGCGGTDNGFGGWNRNFTMPAEAYQTPAYLFNSCDLSTSTNDLNSLAGVKVIPNPATTNVLISFENLKQTNHSIAVYNLTGQLMSRVDLGTGSNWDLDVTDFPAGMYMLTFQNERGEIGTEKLIVR